MPSHRRVDDRKDAERRAHVQRREEEAARPARGHVDPFPINVQRSVSKAGDQVDQSRLQAPAVPSDLIGMHLLYSAAALDVLLDKLRTALSGMAGSPLVSLKQESAKVRVGMILAATHKRGVASLGFCKRVGDCIIGELQAGS